MLNYKEYMQACMSTKLKGTTPGSRVGVREAFITATRECRREYCEEVALEKLITFFKEGPSEFSQTDLFYEKLPEVFSKIVRGYCACAQPYFRSVKEDVETFREVVEERSAR